MKREKECRCLNFLILGQQALLFLTSYIELELELEKKLKRVKVSFFNLPSPAESSFSLPSSLHRRRSLLRRENVAQIAARRRRRETRPKTLRRNSPRFQGIRAVSSRLGRHRRNRAEKGVTERVNLMSYTGRLIVECVVNIFGSNPPDPGVSVSIARSYMLYSRRHS